MISSEPCFEFNEVRIIVKLEVPSSAASLSSSPAVSEGKNIPSLPLSASSTSSSAGAMEAERTGNNQTHATTADVTVIHTLHERGRHMSEKKGVPFDSLMLSPSSCSYRIPRYW